MQRDTTDQTTTHAPRSFGRLALAMIAGGVLTLAGGKLLAPQTAEAQRSSRVTGASGILNPADQRNEMIRELRKISEKIESLEKTLDKALDVNVVTMPASFNNQNASGD